MRNKNVLFILVVVVTLIGGIIVAHAADPEVWPTYLEISTGSTHNGTKRKHSYNNQSIEFHWNEIGIVNSGNPYLNVTLYKRSFLSYKTYAKNALTVEPNTSLSLLTYRDSGSGHYYFGFNTGNSAHPTGYFKADPVYIKSYS